MQRWLSLRLSESLGVWANAEFPFPRAFFQNLFDKVLKQPVDSALLFDRNQLTWIIAAELATLRSHPEFSAVAKYLGQAAPAQRRVELSEQIAHSFDQYVVYRPDLIEAWELGQQVHWQAQLWRRIVARTGTNHFAALAKQFLALPMAAGAFANELPERLSIVGISSLPPLHVALVGKLAQAIDVHYYWLSPCQEYWVYTRDARELLRIGDGADEAIALGHWEQGNPLLAGWGRQGREFLHVLESSLAPAEEHDSYLEPGTASMLQTLQSDVLALRVRGGGGESETLVVEPSDCSIQVHACHSTIRQLEALKDVLLAAFEQDPTLGPHDVVVMLPDVERAAPLIDAVFGESFDAREAIPYRIADRPLRANAELIEAFLGIIKALGGRMKVTQILDLVRSSPVRERFEIPEAELGRLRSWVHTAGVRWGRDRGHRAEEGVPAIDAHTWRFGLRRLLLGIAMPAGISEPFQSVLPCDGSEGSRSELLGRFVSFVDLLFAAHRSFTQPRSIPEWAEALMGLLDTTLRTDGDFAWEAIAVRKVLSDLRQETERASFLEPIDLRFMEQRLAERFEQEQSVHQFMAGGVTFCAMLPMRSIPFRFVCLLDMDDGEFPRSQRPPSFDLIAESPRLGDRSLRDEDRYIFLEALLSARDRFAVFYSGRGIHDNQPRPPSVVVSELLEVLDSSFEVASARGRASAGHGVTSSVPATSARPLTPSALATIEHPLAPYSPQYFQKERETRLFSFSPMHGRAAQALMTELRSEPVAFQRRELPATESGADLTLDALVRMLEHPVRTYAEVELGLRLRPADNSVVDREPVELDALARYSVGDALLQLSLKGVEERQAESLLRAAGLLPHGSLGGKAFARLFEEATAIASVAKRWRGKEPPMPTLIDVMVGEHRLSGVLRETYGRRLVTASFARLSARQRVRAWVGHLALVSSGVIDEQTDSVLVARVSTGTRGPAGSCVRFGGVSRRSAHRILGELCEIYDLGRRGPLPFIAEAAEAYARSLVEQDARDDSAHAAALVAARKVVRASRFGAGGMAADAIYFERFFGGCDLLAPGLRALPDAEADWPDFPTLAQRVFEPLLTHILPESP